MSDRGRLTGARPFFEVPISLTPQRRLLLISYAFPPEPSVGSLRWEMMSRFVCERGWGLDVIMVDPADVPKADYERLKNLPPGVRLYGVPVPTLPLQWIEKAMLRVIRRMKGRGRGASPASRCPDDAVFGSRRPGSLVRDDIRWTFRRPRELVRSYLAWSHYALYRRWARDAADLALRVIEPPVHKAVVTSAPPHLAHEAGRRASRASGLPFVMDMRDPWSLTQTLAEDVASPVWLSLAARCERKAVAQASLIVANTDSLRQAMADTYPEAAERMITVMNGYDDEPLPPARHSTRFTIMYAGDLYGGRDPRPLFAATARVVRELGLTPEQMGIEIIGLFDAGQSAPLAEIARAEGVAEFVRSGPQRPRREALEFLAAATMLVSIDFAQNWLTIPAKIFEYVRFEAWVLALTRPGSAPDLLLHGTGADIVAPDDVNGIAAVLRHRYELHCQGVRPTPIANNGRFSRRSQSTVLLDAIESLTSGRSAIAHTTHRSSVRSA